MFVACDESGTTSDHDFLVIGSLWIKEDNLKAFELKTTEFRLAEKCWGEFEWNKLKSSTSPAMVETYERFISLAYKEIPFSFRCIVIDKSTRDITTYHEKDEELAQFKFMHLLVSRHGERVIDTQREKMHIVFDEFEQSEKAKKEKRVLQMREYIESYLNFKLENVSPCKSHICSAIQLCDLFTGAVSTSWNTTPSKIGKKKQNLINHIENKSGKILTKRTLPTEANFNIWVWNPAVKPNQVSG